jgi:peptide deformylase
MKIITAPNPILNQKCEPCTALDLLAVNQAMLLMRERRGVGLAAPQVGIMQRWFVTHWGELFVNPEITETRGYQFGPEGCLSIPGKQFLVERSIEVVVGGVNYKGAKAQVIQHEIDHLDGILISDHGVPA